MKRILYVVLSVMIILSLCGCANNSQNKDMNLSKNDTVRVVSLAPSVTEILFAIHADDMVVGRTDYCNYPSDVSKIDSVGTYATPNMELIIEKNPKYVLASDTIDENIKKQLETIGITVYVVKANNVEEIENEIQKIGDMLGLSDNAKKVVEDMKKKSEEVAKIKADNVNAITVFCDLGDFYSVGNDTFLGGVLNDIGVLNIAANSGELWPQLSVERIVEANPDIYISLYTTADGLRGIEGLNTLSCLKEPNLLVVDSELADRLQRPGPRIVDAELELVGLIYGK